MLRRACDINSASFLREHDEIFPTESELAQFEQLSARWERAINKYEANHEPPNP